MNGDLITAALTAGGTYGTVWSTVIHPRAKEKKKADADEAQRQLERDRDLDGIPAIEGMTEGTPRLVIRVARVEGGLREVKGELTKVSDGQGVLEKRMDEANGTGKRTNAMVMEMYDDFKKRTSAVS